MTDVHIKSDKTCLGNDKETYIPNRFTYSFAQKIFSPSFLIKLCRTLLLCSTACSSNSKIKHVPSIVKTFSKSNKSDLFFDLLPLSKKVDPLSARLFPLQRDKPLYVTNTLAKQQPDGTHLTNIGLAQPILSGNGLKNKTLPFKETSNSLAVPSLSLEQKDNPLIPLPLQETPSSPETSVVAKDDPKITDSTNNIESKKPNLLAASKPEETCSSIAIEPLNACNTSNVDNNVKTGNVKNIIALFSKKVLKTSVDTKKCTQTTRPTNMGPKVTSSEETSMEHLHACHNKYNNDEDLHEGTDRIKNQEKIKEKIKTLDPYLFTKIIDDSISEIGKYITILPSKYTTALTLIEDFKTTLDGEKDSNAEDNLVRFITGNSNLKTILIKSIEQATKHENTFVPLIQDQLCDKLPKLLSTRRESINRAMKEINQALNNFYGQVDELSKLIRPLPKDCSTNYTDILYMANDYLDLIKNYKETIETILIDINKNITNLNNKNKNLLQKIIESNPEIKNMITDLESENNEKAEELMYAMIQETIESNPEIKNMITNLELESNDDPEERIYAITKETIKSNYETKSIITDLESIENNIICIQQLLNNNDFEANITLMVKKTDKQAQKIKKKIQSFF
ncbi:hypothetical protein ACRRVA_00965 [Candidatus Cardinium hertigii]|uniref:hypothetical protein n=1 Tax=Candidatus Cardinium hertigii TaxID=247481 RepID=UPI003D7ED3D8